MLEEVGEALGTFGGVGRMTSRHRSRDVHQLAFDRRAEATGAAPHQGVQACDRPVEPPHGGHQGMRAPPVRIEADHLGHADIMTPGSDMAPEAAEKRANLAENPSCLGQPTRTLVTGARRSWTENHVEPASADPNTSPLVAPK
jgi:hypothetical protein